MPVIQAKFPRYLAWILASWGQCFSACSISRQVMELRVESGMAGMCLIVPRGAGRAG
jgi:hypothetical protein